MAVTLGARPLADFTEPIQMLKDCHRRIEHFLGVLRKVEAQFGASELTDEARRALETSLNYFANSAPLHTSDEEQSLFPRMRAGESAEVADVMAELDRLEQDHRGGEADHTFVDRLVRDWLATGRLDESRRKNLRQTLARLAAMYDAHIQLEEGRVFVLASRLLKSAQLRKIGEEMKQRRSLANSISPSRPHGG